MLKSNHARRQLNVLIKSMVNKKKSNFENFREFYSKKNVLATARMKSIFVNPLPGNEAIFRYGYVVNIFLVCLKLKPLLLLRDVFSYSA